jgi:NTP pyrophosphatase (non-canonical NTP hydrolase)
MGAFLSELQGGLSMDRPDEKIKQHIPQDELLTQLAEECAELSQAALKLRRALTGINPTPVTVDEARKSLVEEAADVYNVLGLLLDAADNAEIYSIIRRKKARWLNRLEG